LSIGREIRWITLGAALTLVFANITQAANRWWNTTTTGSWTNVVNWWTNAAGTTNPVTAPGASDLVTFNGTGVNGATVVQVDTNVAALGLVFANTNLTTIESIGPGTGSVTIGASGVAFGTNAGNAVITADVVLATNQNWTGTNKTITVRGVVSGAGLTLNRGQDGGALVFGPGANASLGAITMPSSQDFGLIRVTNGTLVVNSVPLQRSSSYTTAPTLAAPISAVNNAGMVISGPNADVTVGTLSIGNANSGTSVRLDSGMLTVTGTLTVAKHNNTTRWSILHVAGGQFFSTNPTNSLVLSPNTGSFTNNSEFFVSGGTATVETVRFGVATDTNGGAAFAIVSGGELYIGPGGVVKANTNASFAATFGVTGGTLGATDDWSTSQRITLGTNPTIKAADVTNGAHNITFDGPLAGGGFSATGAGRVILNGTNTYSGTTAAGTGSTPGNIVVGPAGVITGAALNVQANSSTFFSAGTIAIAGAASVANSSSAANWLGLTGGTFSAGTLFVGRNGGGITSEPTEGRTNAGLYIDGAAVSVAGALDVVGNNSSAPARIDSGSLAVGGVVTLGLNNSDRWSVLDIAGGTFTATNAAGVLVGASNTQGSAVFLVRGGTATVERITFNSYGTADVQYVTRVVGGELHVGSGGILATGTNISSIAAVKLGGGKLVAKDNWTSAVNFTLGTNPVVQAADASSVARDIALTGTLSGGRLTKTGAGTLTLGGVNTYTGATVIAAGTLSVTGSLGTTAVTVSNGATLAGNGDLGGNVTVENGGHHALAVAATPGAQDTRLIAGVLTLNGTNHLDLTAASAPAPGAYTLVTAAGGISGSVGATNLVGVSGTLGVSGNSLVLTVSAASGFALWISGFSVSDASPGGDPDHDGVQNLLEYVLNGNPSQSDASILPDAGLAGTNFTFSFTRLDASEADVTQTFQYGNDLLGWTGVAVPATNSVVGGITITVTENGTDPDAIEISVPTGGDPRKYGRLSVSN
jgi:autotransporter-associated beta strand protein